MLQGIRAVKWVFQGRRPPKKKGHFLPKNGLKMPILATNSAFWALVVTSSPPPTLFCRYLTENKMCCKVWEPENGCFSPPPPEKNGLKMPVLSKNSVFWARVVNAGPPHPISQVID